MTHKNVWKKFIPSMNLPKCRVSIAYDTKDERGIRYAYGHFQFRNGTCNMFWKDGNEQPKSVKAEDIRYWMPVPSLDTQEESADIDKAAQEYVETVRDKANSMAFPQFNCYDAEMFFIRGANWHKQYMAKEIVEGHIVNNDGTFQLICPSLPIVTRNMEEGDRVKLVIIKEDLL